MERNLLLFVCLKCKNRSMQPKRGVRKHNCVPGAGERVERILAGGGGGSLQKMFLSDSDFFSFGPMLHYDSFFRGEGWGKKE